ncbi:MAG: response regulator [Gemmatimonadaceae bacterium]
MPLPRVLIVDDDDAVRLVLRRWFTRRGWYAEEASNGDQARAFLAPERGAHFDVILCDVRMPEMSGPEFYDWLSVARPSELSHLVFTTGDATAYGVAEFLRASGCQVLEKPFELNALWTIAERLRDDTVTV